MVVQGILAVGVRRLEGPRVRGERMKVEEGDQSGT